MSHRTARPFAALAAVAVLAATGTAPAALARHGADDPAGHDAGDDRGGARVTVRDDAHRRDDRRHAHRLHARDHRRHGRHARELRHGRDDGPGHVRHGGDDGPNHR